MARAPFQVLTIPFTYEQENILFAIFQRQPSSGGFWQWISGGGEDQESPQEAAIREMNEEANITRDFSLYKLDSSCTIQKDIYKGHEDWGKNCFVVPEYSFAVELLNKKIEISHEHQSYKWVSYEEAMALLEWDSNKTALWELQQRISSNNLITMKKEN